MQTLTLSVWKCNKTEQEFLMYAQNGAVACWYALDDSVYKSLVSITDAFAAERSLNRLTVFYLTGGICCDAASDGSVYNRRPYCPNLYNSKRLFSPMSPIRGGRVCRKNGGKNWCETR